MSTDEDLFRIHGVESEYPWKGWPWDKSDKSEELQTFNGELKPRAKWPWHKLSEDYGLHLPEFVPEQGDGDSTGLIDFADMEDLEGLFPAPEDEEDEPDLAALYAFNDLAIWGGTHNKVFIPGGRSWSVWKVSEDGDDSHFGQVWDSKNQFEEGSMEAFPSSFNSKLTPDSTSNLRGPTPRKITYGMVYDVKLAFITLQNCHSVFIYDISDIQHPQFSTCINTADAGSAWPNDLQGGDIGPYDLAFIAAEDSSSGAPQLVVSYRGGVSPGTGNVAVFEFQRRGKAPART
eukprot:NODE_182_length_1255_cov_468.203014_g178_i0.p1 GENE.NODE_182_length_1255_cov_468.203014_g178_i0~~NODE_182_length_1255_cov_468.203014_g178_i0.p1  ORF type:complete len:322 (+),score=105.20 NODE_182_length_1255_cov_468.203014_g178_i0:101-967(+)